MATTYLKCISRVLQNLLHVDIAHVIIIKDPFLLILINTTLCAKLKAGYKLQGEYKMIEMTRLDIQFKFIIKL